MSGGDIFEGSLMNDIEFALIIGSFLIALTAVFLTYFYLMKDEYIRSNIHIQLQNERRRRIENRYDR